MTGRLIPSKGGHPVLVYYYDGSDWRAQIIDSDGHVQVDVLGNENLDKALQSVATDRLQVRGEDQIHSFYSPLASLRQAGISGASGYVDSHPCAAGQVWVVTAIVVIDLTSPFTAIEMIHRTGGADYIFHYNPAGAGAVVWQSAQVRQWLKPTDVVRVKFEGALAGDTCRVVLTGHIMTLET